MHRIQLLCFIGNIVFISLLIFLIRKRKLKEEYSLLWFTTSLILFVLIFFPKLIEKLSLVTGTYYLTTLIMVTFFFLFIIVLRFSVTLSDLSEKLKTLTQKLALLEHEKDKEDRNKSG